MQPNSAVLIQAFENIRATPFFFLLEIVLSNTKQCFAMYSFHTTYSSKRDLRLDGKMGLKILMNLHLTNRSYAAAYELYNQ